MSFAAIFFNALMVGKIISKHKMGMDRAKKLVSLNSAYTFNKDLTGIHMDIEVRDTLNYLVS